ncbi:MAG TPA: type IV toxin-antitoxin system AbiEi family antitoxin domain-containing protein [Anaerolineaceae bacterium]|nr:type IV toxin-antitoxin system AbiEi family antitoxin domain-containing protein [Anaerolineaceae bacterium]
MKKSFEKTIKIFKENNGILRTGQAKKLGIHQPVLVQMHDEGVLIKETRGLYRLSEKPPLSFPDFVQVSMRVPNAVICLISALSFHQLTTQIPYQIYIALPQKTKAPRFIYPPLDIVYLSEKTYEPGIVEHILDGEKVKIYGREKTIADCFKFRNKIGLDIAIEALKDYFRQPEPDLEDLIKYAIINRVMNIIEPYIQALI